MKDSKVQPDITLDLCLPKGPECQVFMTVTTGESEDGGTRVAVRMEGRSTGRGGRWTRKSGISA